MEAPSRTTSPLPVDSDNKATQFRPFSLSPPHMRAFHLAWLSLFSNFFTTFSIPPLIPAIRRDLHLTQADIGHAGIASFAGAIFSRLAMGPICDLVGPRRASAAFSLLTAPVVLSMFFISNPNAFIIIRFLIGFSLANFVACQYWMSSMFSGNVVGVANGVSAGWANVGSGLTQLLMPIVYSFLTSTMNLSSQKAWRVSFLFPALFQTTTALMVLAFGQDYPIPKDKKPNTSSKQTDVFSNLLHGLMNYRGWIMGLTYAFSFGVELTTDNIIAQYFYDRFKLNIRTAGAIAASFGLANIVSRPMGGMVSDEMGRRFGIRGRLWGLWVVQTVAGLLCFALGKVESLWGSVAVMCGFSLFVQAASGLVFGVVPFVSKRSLGVISGMTGSGGAVGAVVTQLLLFSGTNGMSTQTSISLMGLLMIVCTLPVSIIYFRHSGGMFCGPSKQHNTTEDDHHRLLLLY